ncbi:MAG: M56 family metallopeptidase [Thermoanaerobaculia bacterium]
MTEHLLVSTIVLAAAMLAARFLPLTARTRYAILLCGIAKFALPGSIFEKVTPEAITVRVFGADAAVAAIAKTTKQIEWLPIVWAAIALLLFARWPILRARTVRAALRNSAPPSQRELDALREARIALQIRSAIDIVRSPICEAPAVLRVLRPVLVLPQSGCDALEDDELQSLVLHECAHVARHDNAATIAQALATSLLWFHPLVWLASSQLTTAREEACDETVADAMSDTDAYLSAMSKICHAIAAPRAAGASCMANSKIRERMEHLVNYASIRRKAFSHPLAVVLMLAVVLASAAVAGDRPMQRLYMLRLDGVNVKVIDETTGAVIAAPKITKDAPWNGSHAGRQLSVKMINDTDILLEVREGNDVVQRNLVTAAKPQYDGEPISLNLKNADIHDVLKTLGELTGYKFVIAGDVTGGVTMNVNGMPWDEALDVMLRDTGNTATIVEKGVIRVEKKK